MGFHLRQQYCQFQGCQIQKNWQPWNWQYCCRRWKPISDSDSVTQNTIWTNFRQHNYPISLICKIYRSANYRISAFFNKPWVTNLATLQKPWVLRKNWFYFWILHKKVDQNQWFETSFGVFKYEKNLKNKIFFSKNVVFSLFCQLKWPISQERLIRFSISFFLNAQNLIWNRPRAVLEKNPTFLTFSAWNISEKNYLFRSHLTHFWVGCIFG